MTLTVVFHSVCVLFARVGWDPVNLHPDEGVQSFAAPGERQVGAADHLWADRESAGAREDVIGGKQEI